MPKNTQSKESATPPRSKKPAGKAEKAAEPAPVKLAEAAPAKAPAPAKKPAKKAPAAKAEEPATTKAPAPAPAKAPEPAPAPAAPAAKPTATKSAKPAKATKSPAKKPAAAAQEAEEAEPQIFISHEEISLRAYYIGERRQRMGWPGTSADDWLEAEAQLRAEALEAAKKNKK